MFKVKKKIVNCRIELLKWRNKFQGNSRRRIEDLKHQLEELRKGEYQNKRERSMDLKNQLKKAYEDEDVYWSQKARVSWLRGGDRNTQYFHACTKGRRKRNKILNLQRGDGTWTLNEQEIGVEVEEYYQGLFTSSGAQCLEEILHGIPHSITDQMNNNLTKPVEEKEVKKALFSIHPNKAPGPDGMSPLFFQKFWYFIKDDVVQAIQSFFHSSLMLKVINNTVISLIPKVDNPTDMKQYRPISLCNVLYKMISKILANRLKNVLNLCISKNQAAFVPGRQILDNVILSHEFLHHLKNKRQGNAAFLALKLDMSKAYDRVEWRFLEAIMKKMGFCNKWINWIMSCIATVTYSFNINGEHRGFVTPKRGIRQGDPLSFYLFLLCSEGMSNVLKKAEASKKISGLKISRRGPSITHLFFC